MVDIVASTPSLRREGCEVALSAGAGCAGSALASLSGCAARACTARGIQTCCSLDRHALAIDASGSPLLAVTAAAARWTEVLLLCRPLSPWEMLVIAKIDSTSTCSPSAPPPGVRCCVMYGAHVLLLSARLRRHAYFKQGWMASSNSRVLARCRLQPNMFRSISPPPLCSLVLQQIPRLTQILRRAFKRRPS